MLHPCPGMFGTNKNLNERKNEKMKNDLEVMDLFFEVSVKVRVDSVPPISILLSLRLSFRPLITISPATTVVIIVTESPAPAVIPWLAMFLNHLVFATLEIFLNLLVFVTCRVDLDTCLPAEAATIAATSRAVGSNVIVQNLRQFLQGIKTVSASRLEAMQVFHLRRLLDVDKCQPPADADDAKTPLISKFFYK